MNMRGFPIVFQLRKYGHFGSCSCNVKTNKTYKIHVLVFEYEMFKMEEGESIKDLIQRFTTITNHLMLFGRSFNNANLVHKLLRSLIKEW